MTSQNDTDELAAQADDLAGQGETVSRKAYDGLMKKLSARERELRETRQQAEAYRGLYETFSTPTPEPTPDPIDPDPEPEFEPRMDANNPRRVPLRVPAPRTADDYFAELARYPREAFGSNSGTDF